MKNKQISKIKTIKTFNKAVMIFVSVCIKKMKKANQTRKKTNNQEETNKKKLKTNKETKINKLK